MEIPPGLEKFLNSIGISTSRLKWRLWAREKERAERAEHEKVLQERGEEPGSGRRTRLPSSLRWLNYEHKYCPSCEQIVDRDESKCPHCGASVPPAAVYKLMRLLRSVAPGGGATMSIFLGVIVMLYVISIFMGGPGAIFSPTPSSTLRFGALHPWLVADGDWWRIMSFGLVHSGLIHIGFNVMALTQLGPMIEREIGPARMLVLITVSQLASGLACYFLDRPVVGASGWLFGLLGFGITWNHRHGGSRLAMRDQFAKWAFYGGVIGLIMGWSTTAHLGGLVGGALMGWICDISPARKTVWTGLWQGLVWLSLGVWLATCFYLFRSIF